MDDSDKSERVEYILKQKAALLESALTELDQALELEQDYVHRTQTDS